MYRSFRSRATFSPTTLFPVGAIPCDGPSAPFSGFSWSARVPAAGPIATSRTSVDQSRVVVRRQDRIDPPAFSKSGIVGSVQDAAFCKTNEFWDGLRIRAVGPESPWAE